MKELYPIKFLPIFKHKIWGGDKLSKYLGKDVEGNDVGESWEISGVEGNLSVVANGFLKGNNLQELIEVYMGDLVGDKVYERFGVEFPLLIKFIDANDVLSVQVHPDDAMAKERHHSYGKTEMWYVMQAEKDAELIVGFNRPLEKKEYAELVAEGTLEEVLNKEKVTEGDSMFMPAGRVHAIGAGVLVAEIQQTSDITYRIFDWNRVDDEGNERELHTDLALDAINFEFPDDSRRKYEPMANESVPIVDCNYFTTNILAIDQVVEKDYFKLDSFVIYMCVDGSVTVETPSGNVAMKKGETVLLPATMHKVVLKPENTAKILEISIK